MAAKAEEQARKMEWLVVIPDKPGMHEKRLEVRAQHLIGAKELSDKGFVKTGGAIFNEKPEGNDASKFSFYGSTIICEAESKEEVIEALRQDIYSKSGVWDVENAQIWPAKIAVWAPGGKRP
ncbi:hypothetical protein GGR50DRAFT_690619 [Xylaria sp. CBS 124048]|nr:hypothetical protein GGR50DRAFT_690619 [Xylaria sp. CBS 124048]